MAALANPLPNLAALTAADLMSRDLVVLPLQLPLPTAAQPTLEGVVNTARRSYGS